MHRTQAFFAAAVLAVGLSLGGCTTVASEISTIATNLSSSSSSDVTTLSDAILAATVVTKATDVAVQTGKLDKGTLTQIKALNNGLHAALTDLENANAQGKSLSFAAFNAALDAWNAYATVKGIDH